MARSKAMSSQDRREATREENKSRSSKKETEDTFLSVSFRYFENIDSIGQSIEKWRESGLIDRLLLSIKFVTTTAFTRLSVDKVIENYRSFPDSEKTKFTCPKSLDKSLDWGVIRSVGGSERIAGFLKNGVFYIVFLDMNHHFFLMKKAR